MAKNYQPGRAAENAARDPIPSLSRRERQIVDALLEQGEAGVTEVRDRMASPPSYDAVRTTLRILEEKGVVRHRDEGRRYLYSTAVDPASAREAALGRLVRTFFAGSPERAALALLRRSDLELDADALARLEERIEEMTDD